MKALVVAVALLTTGAACGNRSEIATFHVNPGRTSVSLGREAAHLFFAEYDRWVQVEQAGQPEIRCALPKDTGGTRRVELLALPGERFLLRDRLGTYGAGATGHCLDQALPAEATSLGWFDEVDGHWTFTEAREAR